MKPTIAILQHSEREIERETKMERRLFDACVSGDAYSLRRLLGEDELLLDQVAPPARATPLHLAARFGHAELAAEIVRLRPAMVGSENARMETPLHEACREGSETVAGILIGEDSTEVCRLNREGESALSLACRNGHLGVVKLLLSGGGSMVLRAEADAESTSLHSAAMSGHAGDDVVVIVPQGMGPLVGNSFDSRLWSTLSNCSSPLENWERDLSIS